jgi:hypothetical protein
MDCACIPVYNYVKKTTLIKMDTKTTTVAHLDNKIQTLSITPLTKRRRLLQEQFQNYWKNIHGPVCARLPHLGIYIQHHLKRSNPDLLPSAWEVNKSPHPEVDWDGFAEIGFFSQGDLEKWLPTTTILFDDEQNVFDKTIAYYCNFNSLTLKDRSSSIVTNGTDGRLFIYWFMQEKASVPPQEAGSFLTSELLPALASSASVSRVRYHLLSEHDNTKDNPPAPNVDHFLAREKQHHYLVEFAFENKLEMRQLFVETAFESLAGQMKEFFQAVHAYESSGRYTMVYDGKITLSGLRGASNAELIVETGAINQTEKKLQDFMLNTFKTGSGDFFN